MGGFALGGSSVARLREVEGRIDDHIFLTADHAASADLHENRTSIDAVLLGRRLGVAEETRISISRW